MPTDPIDEKAVFNLARRIDLPETRADYLQQVCGDNPQALARVVALLEVHDREHSFLEVPPDAVMREPGPTLDQAPLEKPGTQIGPYKLLQQIGEGGMGIVYMAEQTDLVQRKVALKVVKPGMDSRQVIARFEAERQALALMDHVNIARVLDAGTTETGRPYFVMELVNGVPITKYCDDNRLTPRQRLELFVPVCQAIQHAHQKGIIHRDIKPSNVMVTLYDGKPVPKVIDFGVAKATEQKLTERTLFTQFGTMIGTLEYMSPEQAEMSALGVDTRSDIYSLGVLLYELLTGSTPLSSKRMKNVAYAEILRLIKEEEPPKPSTRLSDSGDALASISAQRQMEPTRLSKLLRGELDWIVMKTLEKDRNRRYETANAFAADVQRYLNDEQVQACPPSAAYRMGKFARRNKAAIGIALLVSLAGLSLLAGVLWHNGQLSAKVLEVDAQRQAAGREAERADANFAKTLEAVDKFLSQIGHKRLAQVPGMEQIRREVLEEALQFFKGIPSEQADKPSLRREAGLAFVRVGLIQYLLGRYSAAEQSYKRAIELQDKLATEFPDNADYRTGLASSLTNLAILFQVTGRPVDAERDYRRAIALGEKLASEHPNNPEHRRNLARSYSDVGPLLKDSGQPEEADKYYRRALELQEKLAAAHPAELDYLDDFARSQLNFGLLLKTTGRPKEAETAYRRAAQLFEKLMTSTPLGAGYRHELASVHLNLGVLLEATDRPKDAEASYRSALDLSTKLAADFPTIPDYRSLQANSCLNLAGVLHNTDRSDEAEQSIQRSLELFKQLAADFPEVPQYRRDFAGCLNNLGTMMYASQRFEESERNLRRAMELRRQLAAEASALLEDRKQFATALYNLANVLGDLNRDQEAEAAYRQAKELFEKLVSEAPTVVQFRHLLGATLNNLSGYLTKRGEWTEARKLLEQAVEHQTAALKSNPRHPVYRLYLGNHYRSLVGVFLLQGEHAAAAKTAAEAPRLYPEKWQESLRAAGFLAGCVPLAEKDAQLLKEQRETLVEEYARQAVDWLRTAAKLGCSDLAERTKASEFDPLRSRDDFQRLMKDPETIHPGQQGSRPPFWGV